MDNISRISFLTILTISVILTSFVEVEAQECKLTKPDGVVVTDEDWMWGITIMEPVPDVSPADTDLYVFTQENYANAELKAPYNDFFAVEVTINRISIKVSADFKNIEEILTANEMEIRLEIPLTCGTLTRDLRITLTLSDTNNHAPIFTEEGDFIYKLPMPFPANFELSNCLGNELSATDYDISNNNIIFALGGGGEEYFTITSEKDTHDEKEKKYNGVIKTRKELRFDDKQTFKITATDAGTPTRSDVRNIIIEPIVEASSINPKFEKPFYTAVVAEKNENLHIQMQLIEGFESGNIEIAIEDAGASDFDPVPYFSHVLNGNIVTLTWKEDAALGEILEKPLALLLMRVKNTRNEELTGATVIYVKLPGALPPTTSRCPENIEAI